MGGAQPLVRIWPYGSFSLTGIESYGKSWIVWEVVGRLMQGPFVDRFLIGCVTNCQREIELTMKNKGCLSTN